jgi:hypothetical protein
MNYFSTTLEGTYQEKYQHSLQDKKVTPVLGWIWTLMYVQKVLVKVDQAMKHLRLVLVFCVD